jgi:hypothetical protein
MSGRAFGWRVVTLTLEHVRAVDASRLDLDEDFAEPGVGTGRSTGAEHFRASASFATMAVIVFGSTISLLLRPSCPRKRHPVTRVLTNNLG